MKYLQSFSGFHKILMQGNRVTVDEELSRLHPLCSRDPLEYRQVWGQTEIVQLTMRCNEESSITSTIFLTKMHYSCLNLIKRKHQVKPTLRAFYPHLDRRLQKCQRHENQGENEELLQIEGAKRAMMTVAHVILNWILLLRK